MLSDNNNCWYPLFSETSPLKILFMNSASMFFSLGIMFSSLLVASMNSWFSSWMGLEMNFLCFIMILAIDKEFYSMESLIKYFLINTWAGQLLLMNILVISSHQFFTLKFMYLLMLIKLGMPPFHWWFPSMTQSMSWDVNIIFMTLQKLAPMFMMQITISLMEFNYIVVMMVIISMFISVIMGLNQFQLRKLMAYSSMSHFSWMMSSMLVSNQIWLKYFIIYCIMSIMFMFNLNKHQMISLNDFFKMNPNYTLILVILLLNLSGVPPLAGFYPKLLIINSLISNYMMSLSLIMIMLSLISFFFYFRMMWIIMTETSFLSSNYKKDPSLILVSLMTLIVMSSSLLWYKP